MVSEQTDRLEERVSIIEGRMTEISQVLNGLRDAIVSLDGRIGSLEARTDARFAAFDHKLDMSLASIRADMSSDFRWLVAIQVTTLVAIVASLIGTAAMR